MIETKELKGKISSDNKIKGGNTVISGPQGKDGLSAYEVAVKNGYIGSEEEWLKTLKGEKGDQGEQGIQGDVSLKQLNELQTKTIKCLQEVETPTPVSGTSIDLNDSAEAKFSELKISGNSKQETREGYNILPNNVTTMNISGVDFTVNKDGTVLVNGTPTANTILQLNTGITYSAGTYKLSGCPKGGATDTYRLDLMNKANNNIPVIDTGNGVEFTITEETTFIPRIRIQSGVTINKLLFEPMLVSDTSKTKYEPYGASPSPDYPSEVKSCGDNINLFDTNNSNVSYYTRNEKETYKINNSNSISVSGINIEWTRLKLTISGLLPNTKYTISAKVTNTSGHKAGLLIDDSINNVNSISPNTNFTSEISFTTDSEGKIIIQMFSNWSESTLSETVIFDNIKLEKGSTPTPYSPYGQGCINEVIDNGLETTDTNYKSQTYTIPTQQPFRAIGDIRDTFIKKNNKWYERHYIYRKILDENMNWVKSNYSNDEYFCAFSNYTNNYIITILNSNSKSNYFTNGRYTDTSTTECIGISNTASTVIKILANRLIENTVVGLNNYLTEKSNEGKPLYIDFILSTPTDIECTEEQSTILFDIEQNAKTYKNITQIYSTDEVSANIEVTYKKDIETLFNKI